MLATSCCLAAVVAAVFPRGWVGGGSYVVLWCRWSRLPVGGPTGPRARGGCVVGVSACA